MCLRLMTKYFWYFPVKFQRDNCHSTPCFTFFVIVVVVVFKSNSYLFMFRHMTTYVIPKAHIHCLKCLHFTIFRLNASSNSQTSWLYHLSSIFLYVCVCVCVYVCVCSYRTVGSKQLVRLMDKSIDYGHIDMPYALLLLFSVFPYTFAVVFLFVIILLSFVSHLVFLPLVFWYQICLLHYWAFVLWFEEGKCFVYNSISETNYNGNCCPLQFWPQQSEEQCKGRTPLMYFFFFLNIQTGQIEWAIKARIY